MTLDEREDFEERIAIVLDGNPGMSVSEAERIAKDCIERARLLPLTQEPRRTA